MSAGPTPVRALFHEVVGQPVAVDALVAAAVRPVHAYLLLGPPGSGMEPATRGFAAALLCAAGGCGECRECHLALAGHHPDLVVIERSGAVLGMDEARRMVSLAQRRPREAARQVLVLPDLHLAVRAAPALLKTLEEPPGPTVFVLTAERLGPELATVASRCVTVPFGPVPTSEVAHALRESGVPEDLAVQVAEASGGDLDRAHLLARDPGVGHRTELWRAVPTRLDGTGAATSALVSELLEAIEGALEPLHARQQAELELLGEEASRAGERGVPGRRELTDRQRREERRWRAAELRAGLGVLARAYRDRLVVGFSGSTGSGSHVPVKDVVVERVAIERITEVSRSLEHNPNQRLALEGLLTALARL